MSLEKDLYHRSPYLLLDEVVECSSTQTAGVLIARFHNPMGDSYDTNNFDPERPALGVLCRIKDAKFKSFAKPGDTLRMKVE